MNYKIDFIKSSGLITIIFDKAVFNFQELNDKMIDLIFCSDAKCSSESKLSSSTKPWVEVTLIVGSQSDVTRMGFNYSS